MDGQVIKRNFLTGKNIEATINYLIKNNIDINKIDDFDIFKNTYFLWSVFNCLPDVTLQLLKYKKELKLDINKPSEFSFKLSPLIASILKGRTRKCEISVYTEKQFNTSLRIVIDTLIDESDIDLKYTTFHLDALKSAILMFDYDTVKKLLKKDISLFTIYHYYCFKFNYSLINDYNDKELKNYINKRNEIKVVSPEFEFTNEFIRSNIPKITKLINSKINKLILDQYEAYYYIILRKWSLICKYLNSPKTEKLDSLIFIGNTYEPFTMVSYDILYLSILKNPDFTLILLDNKDKFKHLINNPYSIYNDPIVLANDKLRETKNDIYQKILDKLIL
jgi:hypothetical protein